MSDLYATLGVDKSAESTEIKKAYRRLAREYHPDANPGDSAAEERFKQVQAAYDVVGDDEKRAKYDRGGFDPRGPGFGAYGHAGPADFDLGSLGDLFRGVFGGGGRPRAASRGRDLETVVTISFEDALQGLTVKVPVEAEAACTDCQGSGAAEGTSPLVCPDCGGRGVVSNDQGPFALSEACARCRGTGRIVETPCPTCRGAGSERRMRRYQVKIPAGVKDGTRIRLAGRGEPGRGGGPQGDLYVTTRVEASPIYERRGSDLVINVPVTFPEAALGADVEVPTPDGRISLKVPAGSANGRMLRVPGRGAPNLNSSGQGDLLARIRVVVPESLSSKEREAIEALRDATHMDPREHLVADG